MKQKDGFNKLLSKPDITITENASIKYIGDAKYKEIDNMYEKGTIIFILRLDIKGVNLI